MEQSHRNVLRKNRIALARDLEVSSATSFLYSRGILSENARDEILAMKTQSSKSEKLLDILPRCGPEAFDVFVEHLQQNQDYLAKLLKPSMNTAQESNAFDSLDAPRQSSQKPMVESSDEVKPSIPKDEIPASSQIPEKTGTLETQIDGYGASLSTKDDADEGDGSRSSKLTLKNSSYKDGLSPSDIYPMTHHPRGRAFIINNKNFQPSSGMHKYPRNGTDVDAEALNRLFNTLGFTTVVYNNRTTKETVEIFDYYATMDHSNYDCIICAVLTHGEESLFYTTDGKLMIKELTSKFRSRQLRGIPKLFFFQACQGFEYMEGVEEIDGAAQEESVDEVDAPGNNKITLPIEADFLYAYSTVPGYYSWRNSVRGSWFVQAIVSVFKKYARSMDVLRMMTRVNAEVARQRSNTNEYFSDNKKQIPSIISQLRKELYFFPENVLEESGDNTDATHHKREKEKKCAVS